jgi:RNA polymerase sigma-70 factor (ECF subfamily)
MPFADFVRNGLHLAALWTQQEVETMAHPSDTAIFVDDVVALIPALRTYAWSLTKRGYDADDLLQETLTKAIANQHRFKIGTNLRAWLFTIMRNTFYNSVQVAAREPTNGADCASRSAVSASTQEWTVFGGELMRVVSRLPRHYREMLILVVMHRESYKDAARICGCTIGTVKSRVNRARAFIIRQLKETRA